MDSKSNFYHYIFFLSIYLPAFLCRTHHNSAACHQPFHCANIPTITPPFWNIGTPCRAHPAFALDCRGAVPFLTISGLSYRVLEIDYFSHTLKVARHDLWNNLCLPILLNTTLKPQVFQIPQDSDYTTLTLFYNCTGDLPRLTNHFRCRWADREALNLFKSGDDASTSGFNCSQHITVPVAAAAALALDQSPSGSGSKINVVRAALSSGFLIQWSADMVGPRILADTTSDCSNYASSSSNCTYDPISGKNVCHSRAEAGTRGCAPPSGEEAPPPPAPTPDNVQPPQGVNPGSSSDKTGIILGLVFGALALFAAGILTYWCCKGRRLLGGTMNPSDENCLLPQGSLAPKRYEYSEIKKITESFSDKLGEGGYGKVYKGTLPNGSPVAVKVLEKTNGNGEEFSNEVASISRTSHVNIVNLLGFCNENDNRVLVYEFMANKSLDKFLSKDGNAALHELSIEKLFKIAVGVAKGLQYLHEGCNTKIVHFDIKPQNILLDEDFCPKISDFGLSKLCPKNESKLPVRDGRGTYGYMAPEVCLHGFGQASHKSDVYSYGMMVLQMVGARNTAEMEAAQSCENYFPDKVYENVIVSKAVGRDETEMKMYLVGFWCIQSKPEKRFGISKVVEMLEGNPEAIGTPPNPF